MATIERTDILSAAGLVAPAPPDGVNRAEIEFFTTLRARNSVPVPA